MLLELLRQRRSIRRFSDEPVSQKDQETIIEAVLRSPSSKSRYPWEFIVVTDTGIIEQMAQAKPHGSSFLRHVPFALVVCADTSKSDGVWVEDAAIAALVGHFTAADLGLGSCWVQIREREHDETTSAQAYLEKVLDLPEHIMVEAIIGIGHAQEEKPGHPEESLLRERISYDRFGKKTP